MNPLDLLSTALGYLMEPCYVLTGNWWLAILLFTAVTKVILLPISLWCQKNSIKMVSLMPEINRIKVKYFGDKETIGEEQVALFKREHYHGFLSIIPLAIQLLILIGLINVIYTVAAENPELAIGLFPYEAGGLTLLFPLAAGVSAWLLGIVQNKIHPLQKEQSRMSQMGTNGLSIGISLMLGIFVSLGVGFYWICSNLLSIFVQIICNLIINPKKYVDYDALQESKAELERLENLGKTEKNPELRKREKADYKKFFSVVNKHLVFYSEGSGFYKYFQDVIEYLLAHSNITIHYVTSDPNDQIFGIAEKQPRIRPYYIGEKRLITLMMKMDADIVVMTMPDLDTYHIKRSYVRKDVEYIFIPHGLTSIHMVYRNHALDNFDTYFCVGPHQIAELQELISLNNLPEKKFVECGYGLLDNEIKAYGNVNHALSGKVKILIAPSHQEDNIFESCIDELLTELLPNGYEIVVRPHPQSLRRYPEMFVAFQERYREEIDSGKFIFQNDFSSNSTVFEADILITDWSTIAYEYAFTTLRPVIFINTKMKVINPEYQKVSLIPTDILWRDEIGTSIEKNELYKVCPIISDYLCHPSLYEERIMNLRNISVFNVGNSGKIGGSYILNHFTAKTS